MSGLTPFRFDRTRDITRSTRDRTQEFSMKKTLRMVAGAFAIAAFTIGCSAQADQTTDKLKAKLQTRLSDVTIKGITKSPITGLYEVNLGTQIVYSDANGDYLLLGDLVDAKTRKNLTEARLAETNRIDFASLPFANAVKVVRGNGARKIAVFSDPNCPYCKQLETSLKSIDNVTVYTFLYPVLSPDSTVKSKSIWCSADRAKAWESWMQDHQAPTAAGTCDTAAINSNLALGHSMNVDGTPTVFLADGRRLPGAVPADRLDREMSAVH
jgi:thiol:disulfide interchange protein DsbC